MSAHTPGPWRVSDQDFMTGVTAGYDVMCGDPESSELLCVAADLRSLEDARLIAAAPDLLDAVKAILDFEAGYIPLSALVEIARRNIAKARGVR